MRNGKENHSDYRREGKTVTPREISTKLNVPYAKVLEILRMKIIPAKKVKNRWNVTPKQFANFKLSNDRKIKTLQNTYIDLYWQGLTINQIQDRAVKDFKEQYIVASVKGFAETTIYEALKA